MRFRFIGQYTNGHTSNSVGGVTFHGHDPTEVPDALIERFRSHVEFEAVHPLDYDGDGKPGGSLPTARRKGLLARLLS